MIDGRIGERLEDIVLKKDEIRAVIELYADIKIKKLPHDAGIAELAQTLLISKAEAEALLWRVRERWAIEDQRLMRPRSGWNQLMSVVGITLMALVCIAGMVVATVSVIDHRTQTPPPVSAPR